MADPVFTRPKRLLLTCACGYPLAAASTPSGWTLFFARRALGATSRGQQIQECPQCKKALPEQSWDATTEEAWHHTT